MRRNAQTILPIAVTLLAVACGQAVITPQTTMMPGDDPRWHNECSRLATVQYRQGEALATGILGGGVGGAGFGAAGGAIAGDPGRGAAIGSIAGGGLGLLWGIIEESRRSDAAQTYSNRIYNDCMNAKRAGAIQPRYAPPPQYAPPPPSSGAPGQPCRLSGKYVRLQDGSFREICE